MAKVAAHYDEGVRMVTNEMRRIKAAAAMGQAVTLPADADAWVALLNPEDKATAPSGDPAYGAAAGAAESGVVQVTCSADCATNPVVTVTRPVYADLTAADTAISFADL